jgi:hypothetical protein
MLYPAPGAGSAHTARREPWLVSLGPACNGTEGPAPTQQKTPALSSPAPASLHRAGTSHQATAKGAGNTRPPGGVAAAGTSVAVPATEPAAQGSAGGRSDRAPRHQAPPSNQATGRSRTPTGHHQGPVPLPGGGDPPAATRPQTASRRRPKPAAGLGAHQLEPPRLRPARRQMLRQSRPLPLHPRWAVAGPAGWCQVGLV